jgi:hypothetical protein
MQLLNPIWLLVSAAVVIPVLVHLWNLRKGKTLLVGSIALLTTGARQQSRSFRITNWPLLLLRCLLIVLLALLLAKPVRNNQQETAAGPGWILVPAHQLAAAYAQYAPQMDSLLAAGATLHNLSPDFEIIQLQDTAQYAKTGNNNPTPVVPPWSLLKVLDANLPNGFPLQVFINNRIAQYEGNRPVTHLALHWHSFTAGDSMAHSPAFSYLTAEGKIRQMEWVSKPKGNYYQESPSVSSWTADVDTSTIRVAIYPGKNRTDAQYVKAAVLAIEQYTHKRITTSLLSDDQEPARFQHLIFRLDDQAPRANLLSHLVPRGILFQYDSGTVVPAASWLQQGYQLSRPGAGNKLYQYKIGRAHV